MKQKYTPYVFSMDVELWGKSNQVKDMVKPFQRLVFGLPEAAILRVTDRMVTNSSADDGWIPTVLSNCAFVAPHFIATAIP